MRDIKIIGRENPLYTHDLQKYGAEIDDIVQSSSFLIIGAAGTIGQATTKEIFSRHPKRLHAVDISENNLVELVRDIRSSLGYINGEFKTFAIVRNPFSWQVSQYKFMMSNPKLPHHKFIKDLNFNEYISSIKFNFKLKYSFSICFDLLSNSISCSINKFSLMK